MTSDLARARISAAVLVAGTVVGVALAAGPVLVVREELEQRGVGVDGSAVVAPAFSSAVVALLIALVAWHRSFVGNGSWATPMRSRQVAVLGALTPVAALLTGALWALLASRPERPVSSLVAATAVPLLPGVAAVILGTLVSALSRRLWIDVLGSSVIALGLAATIVVEPALFGWIFLSTCLFVVSRTLRPGRQQAD